MVTFSFSYQSRKVIFPWVLGRKAQESVGLPKTAPPREPPTLRLVHTQPPSISQNYCLKFLPVYELHRFIREVNKFQVLYLAGFSLLSRFQGGGLSRNLSSLKWLRKVSDFQFLQIFLGIRQE